MYTARFSEQVALLDVLDPDEYVPGEYNTGFNSLRDYPRVAVILLVGDMAQGSTLNLDLEQGTTVGGDGIKAIAGKSITELTNADVDDNCRVVIELRTEELDVDGGFDCINAEVTVFGGNVDFALVMWGLEGRYLPVPVTPWEEVVD